MLNNAESSITTLSNAAIKADKESPKPALLQTVDLKKYFRISRSKQLHAVDGINLKIEHNEILGLVGESGSGKSTLGKTLVGLLDRTGGEVLFAGEALPKRYRPQDFRRNSKRLQMIFQDPFAALNPRMTAFEAVSEPLAGATTISQPDKTVLTGEWLEKVGLDPRDMGRYPHEFSGGQCQRLNIARALIAKPQLLICDEPISALDVSIQAQIVNLLKDIRQRYSLSMLFIAHDLAMVRYISDRIAVMYMGHIIEEGPADDVYLHPLHPYTQHLIAANPSANPRVERSRPRQSTLSELTSPINPGPGCLFAPRCPRSTSRCEKEKPLLTQEQEQHKVACFIY